MHSTHPFEMTRGAQLEALLICHQPRCLLRCPVPPKQQKVCLEEDGVHLAPMGERLWRGLASRGCTR